MGYEVKHIPKNNIVKDEPLVETVIVRLYFKVILRQKVEILQFQPKFLLVIDLYLEFSQ